MKDRNILGFDIGLIEYDKAFDFQTRLRQERMDGRRGDTLIFCEHPSVYTVGRQDCSADWLSTDDEIKKDGICIVRCNRGGRITYHGPGQLVVYFILDIKNFSDGIRDFVSKIELVSVDLIAQFNLPSGTDKEYPGVWVGGEKIVAIGLHIEHGFSMHGISINVDPNLSHYRHIVPCGIRGRGVTSLKNELQGSNFSMKEVKQKFITSFEKILGCRVIESDYATEKVRSPESPLAGCAISTGDISSD